MKATDLLMTSWRSGSPTLRWAALIIFALTAIAAGVGTVLIRDPRGLYGMTALLSLGLTALWAMWLSAGVVLAQDARRLRLPGIERRCVRTLLLAALLSIGVPALAMAWTPAQPASIAAILSLGVGCGLCFALLPQILAGLMGLLPLLCSGIDAIITLPRPGQPHFLPLCLALDLLMFAVVAMRWRRLVRSGAGDNAILRGAMVTLMVRQSAHGRLVAWSSPELAAWTTTGQTLARTPNWMAPQARLGDAGPARPVRALRLALGGIALPQTIRARLVQIAWLVGPISVVVLLLYLLPPDRPHLHHHGFFSGFAAGVIFGIGWAAVFASVFIAAISLQALHERWRRHDGELSLLALLPGLGDATAQRRHLLRASLAWPLTAQLILTLLVAGAFLALHLGAAATLLAAVAQLGGAALLVALALRIFGGRPLSTWATFAAGVSSFLLAGVGSLVVPLLSTSASADQHTLARLLAAAVSVAWLVLGLALLRIARGGWRAMLARPHPFMPSRRKSSC